MAKKKKVTKKKLSKKSSKKTKTYTHHPDHYNRSEEFLVDPLDEDLRDALLDSDELIEGFKDPIPASKTKWNHIYKLVHADQVEEPLTDAIRRAFELIK